MKQLFWRNIWFPIMVMALLVVALLPVAYTAAAPSFHSLVDLPWSTPVKISDADALAQFPDIAADRIGNLYVTWTDHRRGFSNQDVYFAYRPTGGTWEPNVKVNDDPGSAMQGYSSIAVDATGNAYLVWIDGRNGQSFHGSDIYFSYRPAGNGRQWDTNERVNDDMGTTRRDSPSMVVDTNSNAYVVWADGRNNPSALDSGGTGLDIYFSYRPKEAKAWNANERVNDDSEAWLRHYPSIAVDDYGNAYAAWYDTRNRPLLVFDDIYKPNDIYFALRSPDSTEWGRNAPVNNVPQTVYGPGRTWLTVDQNGNAYTMWADRGDPNGISFFYRPAAGTWQPDGAIRNTGLPSDITADTAGNIHVLTARLRGDPAESKLYDVLYWRRSADGQWSSASQVNDPAIQLSVWPAIAVDPRGNVYVVWADESGVWFSELSATGCPDNYADTPEQAQLVRATKGYEEISVNLECEGDVDWLKVQLPLDAHGTLDLSLSDIPTDCNFDMEVYNANDQAIADQRAESKAPGSAAEHVIVSDVQGGWLFYVKIRAEQGAGQARFSAKVPVGAMTAVCYGAAGQASRDAADKAKESLESRGFASYAFHNPCAQEVGERLSEANVVFFEGHARYYALYFDGDHGGRGRLISVHAPDDTGDQGRKTHRSEDYPIDQLDLRNVRLVLFAGCSTGTNLGDPDNILQTFIHQGAETVIGFSRLVDSGETKIWNQRFWDFWLRDSETAGDAARKAGHLGLLEHWHRIPLIGDGRILEDHVVILGNHDLRVSDILGE